MWTYELCGLNGTAIGEVRNATQRTVSLAINRASTASFTVRTDNELLVPLFEDDTKLRVWRDKTLMYYGYVTSCELGENTGEPAQIKISSVDAAWKLSKRLAGKSAGGTKYEGDKAKSARKIISEVNGEGESGVQLLAEAEYSAAGSGKYVAGPYKPVLSCVNDLAHGFDGFDWRMEPYNGAPETKTATFIAKPTLGGTATAVFERGWGQKNVKQMSYVRDLTGLINRAFHLPDEGLEAVGAVVKEKNDATSEGHRGRFEGIADGYGLTDSTLREKWLEEVIRVRKNPRFVVAMTLDVDDGTGRVPIYGTDFNLGDMVTARAVLNGNVNLFNGLARIYQVKFEIDEQGTDTVTPVLIDEEGESLAA